MSLPTDLQVRESLAVTRVSVIEATHRVRSPKRSTRYRYTRNGIIAGGAILLLTAGAIVATLEPQDIIDTSVTCYQHPSLNSFGQGIQSADVPFDPLGLCSREYPNGTDLTVCTLADGTAGVFPREGRPAEDFCAALGLADWGSD